MGGVGGAASKSGAGRRVAALERSVARRLRFDDALRGALSARREELAAREAARSAKTKELEREAEVLRFYQQRIETMMTGAEVFSPQTLTGCRRYIDVVSEKLRALEAELAQADALVRVSEGAIAQTRREIEQNLGRIDLCGKRVADIRRKQDNAASDASDEEAEEAALARRLRERSVAA